MYPKRKSPRLSGYDYSTYGYYFVTICTHEHKCLFGKIVGEGLCALPKTGERRKAPTTGKNQMVVLVGGRLEYRREVGVYIGEMTVKDKNLRKCKKFENWVLTSLTNSCIIL